jgi:hypothetical protein
MSFGELSKPQTNAIKRDSLYMTEREILFMGAIYEGTYIMYIRSLKNQTS